MCPCEPRQFLKTFVLHRRKLSPYVFLSYMIGCIFLCKPKKYKSHVLVYLPSSRLGPRHNALPCTHPSCSALASL